MERRAALLWIFIGADDGSQQRFREGFWSSVELLRSLPDSWAPCISGADEVQSFGLHRIGFIHGSGGESEKLGCACIRLGSIGSEFSPLGVRLRAGETYNHRPNGSVVFLNDSDHLFFDDRLGHGCHGQCGNEKQKTQKGAVHLAAKVNLGVLPSSAGTATEPGGCECD